MPQLKPINIDFETHQLIEAERKSFDEPPYVALRRLLDLPALPDDATVNATGTSSGRPWVGEGVELPHGTQVKMLYGRGRQTYDGAIVDGRWVFGDRSFDSPSGAASELGHTRRGKQTKLNGWLYMEVMFPGEDEWKRLSALRSEARVAYD